MPMLNAASASHVRSGSAMRAGSLRFRSARYRAAPIADCLRVEAVDDAEMARGFLGQLHQAAHAGFAGRDRIPLRFLVRDRGEQAPFDAAFRLRFDERLAPFGQRRADALLEYAGVDSLDLLRACAK